MNNHTPQGHPLLLELGLGVLREHEAQVHQRQAAQQREAAQRTARLPEYRQMMQAALGADLWQALGFEEAQPRDDQSGWEAVYVSSLRLDDRDANATLRLSDRILCFSLYPFGHDIELHLATNDTLLAENRGRVARALASFLAQSQRDREVRYQETVHQKHLFLRNSQRTAAELREALAALSGFREEDRAALTALGQERLAHAEQREAEAAAKRAHTLTILQQIIAAAQTHVQCWEEYEQHAKGWAEEWTEKLWQPFCLLKVRYTAPNVDELLSRVREILQEAVADIDFLDLDALTEEVYCLPGGPNAEGFYQCVDGDGRIYLRRFSSIISEEQIAYLTPTIDEPLLFHRSHRTESDLWWVNLPPFVEEAPAPFPAFQPTWRHVLETVSFEKLERTLQWRIEHIGFESVAKTTPEQWMEGWDA